MKQINEDFVTIRNESLEIKVKSLGAELTSLKTISDNCEYLWQCDVKYWTGQSPILFPIVGRVENNKYKIDDKEYELGIHGFAMNSEFILTEKLNNSLTYKLCSNSETLKKYPYKFELGIKYKLEKKELAVSFEVKNIDNKMIWFSIGAHPGFNCPLDKNESFDDYSLIFEHNETVNRLLLDGGLCLMTNGEESFLNNEKEIKLSAKLFEKSAIILKKLKSNKITLKSKKCKKNVSVMFAGFPYLGIWTMPNAPYVCIEPWYGLPSTKGQDADLKTKEGILSLEPEKTFQCLYKIIIGNLSNDNADE